MSNTAEQYANKLREALRYDWTLKNSNHFCASVTPIKVSD